ncbi:MAG: hypothetical protein ABIT01_20220 [Thermoanaerobaculia bacterium]
MRDAFDDAGSHTSTHPAHGKLVSQARSMHVLDMAKTPARDPDSGVLEKVGIFEQDQVHAGKASFRDSDEGCVKSPSLREAIMENEDLTPR